MDEEKEDRISLLPDSLLLGIISRLELSTKQVIKTTSSISKRWQHLWTRLPTIVFVDQDDVTNLCHSTDLSNYFSFIDKTLTQCPTNESLKNFKLHIKRVPWGRSSQVNSWIRYAITRNVQEIDYSITGNFGYNNFFFNISSVISMRLSDCVSKPNCAILWDKLQRLCIDRGGLEEYTIGKILSGSPCLEILELNDFDLGRIRKSLFGNLVILERLSCDMKTYKCFSNDNELFLDDARSMSMKLLRCAFNPPNGAIRWDKLKFLRIKQGKFDEDLIGKILSGSPCLETLELDFCSLSGCIPKSLFGNFGVLERLSCGFKTYERFSDEDELFLDDAYYKGMKFSCCLFNPPNGGIRWGKLHLTISENNLTEDLIEKILSNPCLETLELNQCSGFRRIHVTSKSVKKLVLSGYLVGRHHIDTIKINAPYILSLTIEGNMNLKEFLFENVSSLVKVDLNYRSVSNYFSDCLKRDRDEKEVELLRGILSSLGHVSEIALGDKNLQALSSLQGTFFKFRKGSYRRGIDPHRYRVFSLIHK